MDIQALISAAISGQAVKTVSPSAKPGLAFADIVQALSGNLDPAQLAEPATPGWALPALALVADLGGANAETAKGPQGAPSDVAEAPADPLIALLLPAPQQAANRPGQDPDRPVGQPLIARHVAADVAVGRQDLPLAANDMPASADAGDASPLLPPGLKATLAPPALSAAEAGLGTVTLSSMPEGKPIDVLLRSPAVAQAALPGIATPLGAREWSSDFAQRVVWMVGQRAQFAEIAINPPNLGGVEVRLSMNEQSAGAQFYSPHASVRDALEAAMPRLRELLADAGITLGQAEVRDQAFSARRDWAASQEGQGDPGPAAHVLAMPGMAGRGLIDLYA